MFIIPTIDVLLLGMAITIVLAALEWFIRRPSLRNPWAHKTQSWMSQHRLRGLTRLHPEGRILSANFVPWEG
jgi:hypothetical protein